MVDLNPVRLHADAPTLVPPTPQPWMDAALCAQVDPELFFEQATTHYESKPNGTRETKAKSICDRCPVQGECLEYAIAHDERYGIWGGMTYSERRRLQQGRTA